MPSAYIPIYVAVFFTVVFMLCECLLVSEVMIKTIKVMFCAPYSCFASVFILLMLSPVMNVLVCTIFVRVCIHY